MEWREHLTRRRGAHAFLAPSNPAWVNYDERKLLGVFRNKERIALGTKLHAFVEEAIRLGIRLADGLDPISSFTNDAIDLNLTPEQVLYFSDYAFGTADAIGYEDHVLRIHDLKTGVSSPRNKQLEIYAALFCLEYSMSPNDISIVLRIYQKDTVIEWFPNPETIFDIMDIIINHNKVLEEASHGII